MSPYYRDGNGVGKACGYLNVGKVWQRCGNRNFFAASAFYQQKEIRRPGAGP